MQDAVLNGATRLVVIVGDPIAQVKSPVGMSAAFAKRGQNAICVPVHVAPSGLGLVLAGLDAMRNVDGIIVTVPHKLACVEHCATSSERSRQLGAVNVIRRNPSGGWHGDMLDGLGFVAALRKKGDEPRDKRALLAGAGGAGSAIGLALIEAGVASLAIHDADQARRDGLISRLRQSTDTPVAVGSADPSGFDLIANATPAGMKPHHPHPVEVAKLTPAMMCGCVITAPLPSPWLAAAQAVGCRTAHGVDMYEEVQTLMLAFFEAGSAKG